MKKNRNRFQYFTAFIPLAMALGLTGCQSSGDRFRVQQRGDRQVAGEVKKELRKDQNYHYPDVEVVVYDGTVQLVGFVSTPGERSRAAELATRAKGARQVINGIALKPARPAPAQSDTAALVLPAPTEAPAPAAEGAASPDQPASPNP